MLRPDDRCVGGCGCAWLAQPRACRGRHCLLQTHPTPVTSTCFSTALPSPCSLSMQIGLWRSRAEDVRPSGRRGAPACSGSGAPNWAPRRCSRGGEMRPGVFWTDVVGGCRSAAGALEGGLSRGSTPPPKHTHTEPAGVGGMATAGSGFGHPADSGIGRPIGSCTTSGRAPARGRRLPPTFDGAAHGLVAEDDRPVFLVGALCPGGQSGISSATSRCVFVRAGVWSGVRRQGA